MSAEDGPYTFADTDEAQASVPDAPPHAGPRRPARGWATLRTGQRVALIATGFMVIGGLGPWAEILFVTIYGFHGDGWIIAFAAVAAGLGLLLATDPTMRTSLAVGGGALGGLVALRAIASLASTDFANGVTGMTFMSWGLPLALLASLVAGVSAAFGHGDRLEARQSRRVGVQAA